ncbi:unnamed protein product [Fraxinus pennsylvanica]|uniref:Pentatricopeptide repeat-containing protein n=1 Tax=Fraxinus pennsylvanica TaxID=56036 RepID=A0AAD1ZHF4_9LAMI|nr:unnamed protein product [Fraxinus pennsylvanica]
MAAECSISSLARRCRAVLRACTRHSDFDSGRRLHAATITTGLLTVPNSFLRNAILHMYSACYDSLSARKMFDQIPITCKDTVDWTTLMGCYIHSGLPHEGVNLFVSMRREQLLVDEITIVAVFNACAKLGDNVLGVQGQVCMVKMGLGISVKACNAAMDMYVKCGLIGNASRMFDEMSERSVVSWTVLLGGVVKWEGLEKGRLLFDEMPERNEYAWTIMIAGYIENGFTKEGFRLLNEMVFVFGFCLDLAALCSLLSASAQCGDVVTGKWLHVYALRRMENAKTDIIIFTALLDIPLYNSYSKPSPYGDEALDNEYKSWTQPDLSRFLMVVVLVVGWRVQIWRED